MIHISSGFAGCKGESKAHFPTPSPCATYMPYTVIPNRFQANGIYMKLRNVIRSFLGLDYVKSIFNLI